MTDREQTTLRLPPKLLKAIREQAQEMGVSANALILNVLISNPSIQRQLSQIETRNPQCDAK